jgi:hypothetical protein
LIEDARRRGGAESRLKISHRCHIPAADVLIEGDRFEKQLS